MNKFIICISLSIFLLISCSFNARPNRMRSIDYKIYSNFITNMNPLDYMTNNGYRILLKSKNDMIYILQDENIPISNCYIKYSAVFGNAYRNLVLYYENGQYRDYKIFDSTLFHSKDYLTDNLYKSFFNLDSDPIYFEVDYTMNAGSYSGYALHVFRIITNKIIPITFYTDYGEKRERGLWHTLVSHYKVLDSNNLFGGMLYWSCFYEYDKNHNIYWNEKYIEYIYQPTENIYQAKLIASYKVSNIIWIWSYDGYNPQESSNIFLSKDEFYKHAYGPRKLKNKEYIKK